MSNKLKNLIYIYIYTFVVLCVTSCWKNDDDILIIEESNLDNEHIPYGFYVQINDYDDVLDIKWNVTNDVIKKVVISATSENGEIGMFSEPYITNILEDSIKFQGGTHGELYKFVINTFDAGNNLYWTDSVENLFIEHSKIPKLPLMKIWTNNWKMPSCKYVNSTDTTIGQGIYDNNYVDMSFSLSNDYEVENCPAKIKIRGNASAWSKKKSLKIKLKVAQDLLFRNEESKYKSKEWVLLKDGATSLNSVIGFELSRIFNFDYVPNYQFYNVILNGIWLGSYLLTEYVGIGEIYDYDKNGNPIYYRNNVSNSGFIIERDAYYWNERFYFKTPRQRSYYGYTFKYPKPEVAMIFWDKLQYIKDCITEVEESCFSLNYENFLDVDNFVNFGLCNPADLSDCDFSGDSRGYNRRRSWKIVRNYPETGK